MTSFSENFTDAFEKELAKRADRIFDRLLDEFDTRLNTHIENLLKDAMQLLVQSLDGGGSATRGQGIANNVSAQFAGSINGLVQSAISIAFAERSSQNVSAAETARSRQVNQAYKQSRAQAQSDAAQAVQKGSRNL